MEFED